MDENRVDETGDVTPVQPAPSDQLRPWATPTVTPARIEQSTKKIYDPSEFSSFGPS